MEQESWEAPLERLRRDGDHRVDVDHAVDKILIFFSQFFFKGNCSAKGWSLSILYRIGSTVRRKRPLWKQSKPSWLRRYVFSFFWQHHSTTCKLWSRIRDPFSSKWANTMISWNSSISNLICVLASIYLFKWTISVSSSIFHSFKN